MPVSQAQIGYGCVLGRRAPVFTSIAAAITANASPQVVTPALMTGIAVGTILAIDVGAAALEIVEASAITGTTFTAIFNNSHGGGSSVAIMVPLLEVFKLGGPAMKADMKEVSNMASPNTYKEFIAALREGGDITFEGNYIPKELTLSQQNVRVDFEGGVLSTWCLALPVAGTGIWQFQAMVMSLSPVIPLDDRIVVSGVLRITGKPILW